MSESTEPTEVSSDCDLQIRPFDWPDQQAVIDIWTACGLVRPESDPVIDIAGKMTEHAELFLVGLVDGEIAVTCMASYEGRRGWIDYMAVHPDHQRKGYGRVILAEAEERLRGLNCPKINLRVRQGNTQIISFYEALGYANDRVVSLGKRLD